MQGFEPTGAGGGSQGALGQVRKAALLSATTEARLADERMRAYEDQLLGGKAKIGPVSQGTGTLMTNLTDSKTPFGAITQAASEYGLNEANPDYAQYLRDAATIARAEQMVSPGAKSESMARAAALLSRAGSSAPKATIDAARMTRQALFGPSGGIAQALDALQKQGLESGVNAIKAGDAGAGSVDAANPFAGLIPKKPPQP